MYGYGGVLTSIQTDVGNTITDIVNLQNSVFMTTCEPSSTLVTPSIKKYSKSQSASDTTFSLDIYKKFTSLNDSDIKWKSLISVSGPVLINNFSLIVKGYSGSYSSGIQYYYWSFLKITIGENSFALGSGYSQPLTLSLSKGNDNGVIFSSELINSYDDRKSKTENRTVALPIYSPDGFSISYALGCGNGSAEFTNSVSIEYEII